MPEYDNKNTGVLFKNKKKETDKHPDYTGTYTNGDGEEFWLSAWIKKTKAGESFMTLSTKPNEGKKPEAKATSAVDDGAPF